MLTTPINAAEAIFEAFFDENLSGLPQWRIHAGGAEGLVVVQKWAWVQYDWQRPPAGGPRGGAPATMGPGPNPTAPARRRPRRPPPCA